MMQSTAKFPTPDPPRPIHFKYSVVKGYFLQSEEETDDTKFDFIKQNFGLIDRKYETDTEGDLKQWQRFERFARHLNASSEEGVQYKVLFLGRHGQGWHNVAESKYGTKAWDCYWSMLEGADGMVWADAHLTEVGQGQAKDVHKLWSSLLPEGIPPPETYYVSPLTRTIETADLSFKGLALPEDKPYDPIGKELLREAIGVHTCDRRSTASHIRNTFPHVKLEPGFSEEDPLWTADYREPRSARKYRLEQLLDDMFEHDSNVFLSLTSHSGAIASILEAISHRNFALQTGGVIPTLVRAEKVEGEREKPPHEPSEGPPACTEPPAAVPN
ncbi:phosphoglycerate mutase family protein [Corynespora cassiicola Philippines]|uniref:Phosphoglycerate mutase family protein n=1 Tax=Corynespora cassiicola Philippines TaxID=1448308 RepID=A0A2T2P412_CORCC|nr:phosphoglycerate mutase family protein [Corynespora cassiicola Philippines]